MLVFCDELMRGAMRLRFVAMTLFCASVLTCDKLLCLEIDAMFEKPYATFLTRYATKQRDAVSEP